MTAHPLLRAAETMQQCLLFDCDGTLVDSERLGSIALHSTLKAHGITLDADQLLSRFKGWKFADMLLLLEKELEWSLPDDFVRQYRHAVSELYETQLQPIAGIEYALKHLSQPKAVVSNSPLDKVEQALRVCGLRDYFSDNIYSAYQYNTWKPDPKLYTLAAQDMGFAAERCIVIEDTLVGVQAAHHAGMQTLFYNTSNETCTLERVHSFTSMQQLPELVQDELVQG